MRGHTVQSQDQLSRLAFGLPYAYLLWLIELIDAS